MVWSPPGDRSATPSPPRLCFTIGCDSRESVTTRGLLQSEPKHTLTMKTQVLAAFLAVGSIGAAQSKVRVQDHVLPSNIDNRSITVTMLDGTVHTGRGLRVWLDRVDLYRGDLDDSEKLSLAQIARVETRQRGRFLHDIIWDFKVFGFATDLCSWDDATEQRHPVCRALLGAVFSPLLIYATVKAPAFLVAEGAVLFTRPKVYEIVH
jgi:hypothetical protein